MSALAVQELTFPYHEREWMSREEEMETFQEEQVISDLSFSPTSSSSRLAPLVHDGRFHEDRAFLNVVHGKAQRDYRASFDIRRWPPDIGCGMESNTNK